MNRFTHLVGCRLPVQLAGMAGPAGPELCAAVTDAGGLGMVGLADLPADQVGAVVGQLAERCAGPFGVNFLVPFVDPAAVAAAAGAHVPVVEFFYGDPDADLVARARPSLVLWQVGSADEARAAVDAGVDAVIAQGVEAGGHVRGTTPLLDLVGEVRRAVDVPVAAAGGIATADAVAAAVSAGADAVRVGTAFLAAAEADVHPAYLEAVFAAASGDDTVLTTAFDAEWPDAPHRVLRSALDRALALDVDTIGTLDVGGQRIPVPRMSAMVPTTGFEGDVAAAALYAGTGVGAVRRRRPAAEILAELVSRLEPAEPARAVGP